MVSSYICSINLWMCTKSLFCHFPIHHYNIFLFYHFAILPAHQLMTVAYYCIPNYPWKISKLIQKYQGTDESLLCQFEKLEVVKGTDVVEVPSWNMRSFPPFKSNQDSPNKVEWRGLAQKKKNLMNSIFGHFYLIFW